MAGLLRTDQIVLLRHYLAQKRGQEVAERSALRVTQRRLQQFVQARILRRIEQPVYPRERSGSKPSVFMLDKVGAELVEARLGIDVKPSEWKPRQAEHNLIFMEHTLAVADFRLALQQACLDNQVTLADWTGEAILRKEPVKVEVTLNADKTAKVTLVPDGFCRLVLPSGHTTWIFLEIDRGTVTVEPSHWELRSWRRKVLAYRQLPETGQLQEHFGAESMIVATVITSEQRLRNLKRASERAKADHRFWFTTFEALNAKAILTEPVWAIAGLKMDRQCLLPHPHV